MSAKCYDRNLPFTGLRLINGSDGPEVEAAHIKPCEEGGPDSIRNGKPFWHVHGCLIADYLP